MPFITRRFASPLCALILWSVFPHPAAADSFGSGSQTFEMEFVDVGQPGNPADDTGWGWVPESFRMGKFEVSESMISVANDLGGLGLTGSSRGPNKPVTDLNWFECATFVNWLNTSTGNAPAYKFVGGVFEFWQPGEPGYNPTNTSRNSLAKYFLPTDDEWYKAAFYDPASGKYFDYPTGSDTAPIPTAAGVVEGTAVYAQPFNGVPADIMTAGGLSPYGTMAQGGNVNEWDERVFFVSARGIRGGHWASLAPSLSFAVRFSDGPFGESPSVGFRVASVPEPSTAAMAVLAGVVFAAMAASRRRAA